MDIKSKVPPAKIQFQKIGGTGCDPGPDRLGRRRANAIIERYEMPVYIYRLAVLVMTAMVALSILWAALAKVDVVAEAPGTIIPIGDVKPIQPAFDGVLEKVLVVEGQQVSKGQSLILLDRKPYEAEVKKCQEALAISQSVLQEHVVARDMLKAAIKKPGELPKQKAEIDGISQIVQDLYSANCSLKEANKDRAMKPSLASTSYPDSVSLSDQLAHLSAEKADRLGSLTNRGKELQSKKSELMMQSKEKHSELASAQLEVEKLQSITEKSERQAKAYKEVYEAGGFSMVDYLQAAKTFEQQEHDLIKEKANIVSLQSQIEVLKSQLAQLDSQIAGETLERQAQIKSLSGQIEGVRMKLRETDRHFNLTEGTSSAALLKAEAALTKEDADIGDLERQVNEHQSDLVKAQYSLDQSDIKSPADGVVTAIKTLGTGQVVTRGQSLMVMVPAHCPLVIEARLPNKDIGFVRQGQKARLKLAAFPYQDYGVLEGTVTQVEKSPQEDEKHNSYYKVTIIPKRDWIRAGGKKIPFSSGAAVTAEITIRRKTFLNLILEPIKNAADIHWVG